MGKYRPKSIVQLMLDHDPECDTLYAMENAKTK